jgi:hypothetical protein
LGFLDGPPQPVTWRELQAVLISLCLLSYVALRLKSQVIGLYGIGSSFGGDQLWGWAFLSLEKKVLITKIC